MTGWLSSFDRKRHQRRMNQMVRAVNKNIYNDDLWRGRFVVRQVGTPYFYTYEDKSGAELQGIHLVVTDLLTGQTHDGWDDVNGWCHWNGSRLWWFVNDAITQHFDVWREDDDPRSHKDDPAYDFRKKDKRNR